MSFRGDSGMPSYKRGAYMDTGEVAEWKKMDLRPDPHRQNQMRTGSRSRAVIKHQTFAKLHNARRRPPI